MSSPPAGADRLPELHRDDELLARHHRRGGPACVVTFDSFTDRTVLDRPAFGEALFAGQGIDAIHILSRENRWYQHAGMPGLLAAVRGVTAGYRRVVTYGSSMGGYAALRLAGAVGAHAALALSPQFSVDPARVPWERRWPEASRGFRDVWERALPPPAPLDGWVVYDPKLRDRRHVRLFRAAGYRFRPVPIPGGGHPVGAVLAELGLLRPAILDVVAGRFDPVALARAARAGLPRSAQAWLAASSRTPKRRIARRRVLLERAAALAPDNPIVLSRLALELSWSGRFAEALALHGRALALQPGQPTLLMHLGCTHDLAGNPADALAAMRAACATPAGALYQDRLAALEAGRTPTPTPIWQRLGGQRPRRLPAADV